MTRLANNHIGETRTMNCGMNATIINYCNSANIDIEFEDKTIVVSKDYGCFKRGQIGYPNNHIGETQMMKCGLNAVVEMYYASCTIGKKTIARNRVDIKFEDGVVRKNVLYEQFRQGKTSHPHIKTKRKTKNRIGDTKCMNNGMMAEIVAYRTCNDIDVRYEDGIIIKNKSYHGFSVGQIPHPHVKWKLVDHTGEKRYMNNGMMAEIVAYRACTDIDIRFEDGTLVTNREYKCFHSGGVYYPVNHIGKTCIATNGLRIIIRKQYSGYRDKSGRKIPPTCDIQFEDGHVTHTYMASFMRGKVRHSTMHTYGKRGKGTLFNIQITSIAYRLQAPDNKFPTTYFNYIHPNTKEYHIGTVSDIHQLALDCKLIPEPQLLTFE